MSDLRIRDVPDDNSGDEMPRRRLLMAGSHDVVCDAVYDASSGGDLDFGRSGAERQTEQGDAKPANHMKKGRREVGEGQQSSRVAFVWFGCRFQ